MVYRDEVPPPGEEGEDNNDQHPAAMMTEDENNDERLSTSSGSGSTERFEIEATVRPVSERRTERRIRLAAMLLLSVSLLGLAVFVYNNYNNSSNNGGALSDMFQNNNNNNNNEEPGQKSTCVSPSDPDCFTEDEIRQMKQQLQPKELVTVDGDTDKTLVPHQFLHLHHMKTGGTSMDSLLRCATGRLRSMGYKVPYGNLHECSPSRYKNCVNGKDERCVKTMADASMVSFCAPLRDLPVFSWNPSNQQEDYGAPAADAAVAKNKTVDHIHAITVLRNPVERVWSMYRFKTKFCYKCLPLREVYEAIDNGTARQKFGAYGDSCASQLSNHMTRNLIQHQMLEGEDDLNVQHAIEDVKSFFTIVGLTEDLPGTREMAGMVFPWLAESVVGSSTKCSLPHANKSPQNNRCGANGGHMALPDHPTEEDAELIRKHNHLDMKVYEAAQRHHRLQKVALGLEKLDP